VTQQRGLRVSEDRYLHDATDALNYCILECGKHKLSCAVDCAIRKYFKIPPHGPVYPGANEPKKLVKW